MNNRQFNTLMYGCTPTLGGYSWSDFGSDVKKWVGVGLDALTASEKQAATQQLADYAALQQAQTQQTLNTVLKIAAIGGVALIAFSLIKNKRK